MSTSCWHRLWINPRLVLRPSIRGGFWKYRTHLSDPYVWPFGLWCTLSSVYLAGFAQGLVGFPLTERYKPFLQRRCPWRSRAKPELGHIQGRLRPPGLPCEDLQILGMPLCCSRIGARGPANATGLASPLSAGSPAKCHRIPHEHPLHANRSKTVHGFFLWTASEPGPLPSLRASEIGLRVSYVGWCN